MKFLKLGLRLTPTLRRRSASSIAFAFLVILESQVAAQLTSEQQDCLDQIALQDVPEGAPGIATGIVIDGQIVYSKVGGLEEITTESPITPQSRFNIASNGKQFTALAILQLEAEGKLSLKDDIREYFPGCYGKIEAPITIEHLLTHTSGLRDVYGLWSLKGLTWWQHSFGNGDALDLLRKQEDLNYVPGSEHLYSNSNYILLAELVAVVSNQSFVAYTDAMFQQLGMPHTSFEADHTAIRGPVARPYFNFGTWTGYDWLPDLVGDGCLFSSLEDQLQWEQLVQGSGDTEFDRTLITKSQQLVDAELSHTYGFGLEHRNENERQTRFHAGGTGAWKAYILRYPDRRLSIITLSNSGKTDTTLQSQQMADVFIESHKRPSPFQIEPEQVGPRVEIDEVQGDYFTQQGFMFRFGQSDGKLYLRRDGRNDVQLDRESANVFHEVNDPRFKQEFTQTENGEMRVTAYYNEHAPYSLTRPNIDWTSFEFQSLEGTFTNSETGCEIQLSHDNGTEYTFTANGEADVKAHLISTNRLTSGNYLIHWQGELRLDTPLLLNTDRIRDVKFLRQTSRPLSP